VRDDKLRTRALFIVGSLLLALALALLVYGNYKLSTLSACSTLKIFCPAGLSPTSPVVQELITEARIEIVVGIIIAGFSIYILRRGILEYLKRERKPSEAEPRKEEEPTHRNVQVAKIRT
jgi:hypothetical protein